jgi:hypothetical protein
MLFKVKYRILIFLGYLKYIFVTGELAKLKQSDVLILCSDADRGYFYKNKRYSPIADSVSEKLTKAGISVCAIALGLSKYTETACFGSPIRINGLISRASVAAVFVNILRKNKKKSIEVQKDVWLRVLGRVNPVCIMAIQPPPSLCLAAKELRIPIADIQHGALSSEGYYGITYRSALQQAGWPDFILCWDVASMQWVERKLRAYVQARVLGHPWLERFLRPEKDDVLVSSALAAPPTLTPSRRRILVTLQWGHEKTEGISASGVPDGVVALIKNRQDDVDWWLRVHPVKLAQEGAAGVSSMLESEFEQCQNVIWEWPSVAVLPVVLANVDLHITWGSAVTIEASYYGIKTALLGTDRIALSDWFGPQISSGLAEFVSGDSNALEVWIDALDEAIEQQSNHATSETSGVSQLTRKVKEAVSGKLTASEIFSTLH